MSITDREHYDLMNQFEKSCGRYLRSSDFTKESKDMWPKGYVYASGETNATFLAYRMGYAYGKVMGRDEVSA